MSDRKWFAREVISTRGRWEGNWTVFQRTQFNKLSGYRAESGGGRVQEGQGIKLLNIK